MQLKGFSCYLCERLAAIVMFDDSVKEPAIRLDGQLICHDCAAPLLRLKQKEKPATVSGDSVAGSGKPT